MSTSTSDELLQTVMHCQCSSGHQLFSLDRTSLSPEPFCLHSLTFGRRRWVHKHKTAQMLLTHPLREMHAAGLPPGPQVRAVQGMSNSTSFALHLRMGLQSCAGKAAYLTRASMHTSSSDGSGFAGRGISAPTSFTLGGSGRGCSSARSPPMRCISSSSRTAFDVMSSPCFFLQVMLFCEVLADDASG